jgi:hypothetical protein
MIKHKLCTNKFCAHEWDGDRELCDWCGSKGKTIESIRPFNIKEMTKLVEYFRGKELGIRNENSR